MMRSLYSGVSGLRVHQTKMDVLGNNISNVNTVGFKASTVNFSDIFYQTTQSATGPNAETGAAGQNAKQIGLGANLASIKTQITTHGGAQRTDDPFDLMISDDSFFIVNSGGKNYFTKAGAFEVDASGTLCTSDGATVMGWQPDPTVPTRIVANQVAALRIMSPENMYTEPKATMNTHYSGNIDPKDPQLVEGKPSQMQFYDSLGNLCTAKLSFKEEADGQYSVSVVDVLGPDDKSIFLKRKNDKYVLRDPKITVTLGGVEYTLNDGDFDSDTGKVTKLSAGDNADNFVSFNPGTGAFIGVGAADGTAKSMTFSIGGGSEGLYKEIDVDFSEMTMYSTSGKSNFAPERGGVNSIEGAGKMTGKMYGVSVDTSGKIYGVYDNGDQKLVGQIAVASFANPSGLEAVGNNRFAETQNSGDFDGIGQDISATGGKLSSGVLEMSNVDLSQQFTDMIVTQRGFQANSRIITTSDTMLEELINLKR